MLCSSPMSCQLNHLVLTKTVSSREKAGSLSSGIVRISLLFVRIGAATAADAATARQVTFEKTTTNHSGIIVREDSMASRGFRQNMCSNVCIHFGILCIVWPKCGARFC